MSTSFSTSFISSDFLFIPEETIDSSKISEWEYGITMTELKSLIVDEIIYDKTSTELKYNFLRLYPELITNIDYGLLLRVIDNDDGEFLAKIFTLNDKRIVTDDFYLLGYCILKNAVNTIAVFLKNNIYSVETMTELLKIAITYDSEKKIIDLLTDYTPL